MKSTPLQQPLKQSLPPKAKTKGPAFFEENEAKTHEIVIQEVNNYFFRMKKILSSTQLMRT